MKTGPIIYEVIMARYPEQKPICLNYATVREDIITLIEENKALHFIFNSTFSRKINTKTIAEGE